MPDYANTLSPFMLDPDSAAEFRSRYKLDNPGAQATADMLRNVATLPQRALTAAGDLQRTGEYDPRPALEAAMIATGTPGVPRGALGSSIAKPMAMPEKIDRAAIKIGERIFAGPNHAAAIRAAEQSTGRGFDELLSAFMGDGFVTNTGRFVSRDEAANIANVAHQMRRGPVTGGAISEDMRGLWALPLAPFALMPWRDDK